MLRNTQVKILGHKDDQYLNFFDRLNWGYDFNGAWKNHKIILYSTNELETGC